MSLIDQLNIEYVKLTDTGFEGIMKLSEFHSQPFGYLNGGATLAFCEVVAGMADYEMGKGEYVGVGQTITAHHLTAMKPEGSLKATGTLLHGGKRSHVWDIKVTNDQNQHISQVTVVNAIIPMQKKD